LARHVPGPRGSSTEPPAAHDAVALAPTDQPAGVEGSLSEAALSALPDEALFKGVCRSSERHFDVLYGRYFQRIYAFIYIRARNHADTEELTQETFMSVFRSAEAYGGRSSPLAWVYGVAKNTVANHIRRLRTHRERLNAIGCDPFATTSPTWSYTPAQQLDLDRCAANVDDRLRSVSAWQADAFVMRHAENLSIPEIARRTERSSDAVRSGLYRVKKLLLDIEFSEAGTHGSR
jgi:RNA polymerase sigma-70 factor (ECF subfamily)